ncbi:GNAT family N-acetyltransferase [Dokdonella sp.]|uniref:GNAT family N-acetyltransferase n=1 Tax=Dokdonella sp. TaxID=2291710 RepID=UPI0031BC321D|nr:GNAT family N-acetyltransferase [Dokdonella sp.]
MAELHVRRATIADLEALIALEREVFASDRISARQWRRHLESLTAEVFVATLEQHLLGAALVFFRRNSSVARLYSLAVAAAARGHGVGERLLAKAEHAACRRHNRLLRLEVRRENLRAQRLYERHGYRLIGERRAFYEDGQDARRYEKPLAP